MANLNKSKKYHFIYKTTNLLNGKYYVGMHSTSNLKDGYLGSGKRLRYSIKKYGIENFKLEIVEWFDSRIELAKREKELVNEQLLTDDMCMNLKIGGVGGGKLHKMTPEQAKLWHSMGGKKSAELHKEKRSIETSIRNKQLWKDGIFKYNGWWIGKTHKIETIEKMKGHDRQLGEKNSQYGSQWINDGNNNKKIKQIDIIPNGWKLGRIIKK